MSLRALVPATVATAETTVVDRVVELRAEERIFVARSVEARRNEFALGRMLAHDALAMIDAVPGPILVGDQREPLWPEGVVGSITHCLGYTAAAVARTADAQSVGIDAEPKISLPSDVVDLVVAPSESAHLAQFGLVGGRLLFSAKESIYKAWFPLTQRWLGFHDCHVTVSAIDALTGTFVGDVAPAALSDGSEVARFHGRYHIGAEHIVTAVVVPPAG